MPADLDATKYVSLTSFKKDGTPKSLAVWIVPFDGGYAFTTDPNAFKVRRIRNNSSVTVQVSDFRGRVSVGTTVHSAIATVVEGDRAEQVLTLVEKKYRIGSALIRTQSTIKRLLGKESHSAETAITLQIIN